MSGFGAMFRFLVVAACLVPFTNSQQAAWALAPLLPVAPVPAGDAPGAPVNEEDDERETDETKEGHAAQYRHRPPVRELVATLPPVHASHRTHLTRPRTTPPVPVDPFRNGLGTHYRC